MNTITCSVQDLADLRADIAAMRSTLDRWEAWIEAMPVQGEMPGLPEPQVGEPPTPDTDAPEPAWSDRLVFDFDVSATSPVVKGTWVTAGHIISLIVDGWMWSDILRCHPEITEDDIRACLAYTLAQDGEDITR